MQFSGANDAFQLTPLQVPDANVEQSAGTYDQAPYDVVAAPTQYQATQSVGTADSTDHVSVTTVNGVGTKSAGADTSNLAVQAMALDVATQVYGDR